MQSAVTDKAAPATKALYQPLQEFEIRVLNLQPGQFDDHILAVLVSGCLANLAYDALSYVWGDPGVGVPIEINGHSVFVTENLESALRHIREEGQSKLVWIDAVCINQKDAVEVMAQVRQMRQIYETAQTVITWLGPAEFVDHVRSTARAMEALETFAKWHNESTALESDRDMSSDDIQFLRKIVLNGIHHLPFNRPYWNRLWIIQEATLARKLVVLYGTHSMSFDDICNGLSYAYNSYSRFGANSPGLHISGIARIKRFRDARDRKKVLLLGDLLRAISQVNTTDPRDRVYGLLGLASDGMDILPDYSRTVQEVYIAAAKHVASHGDLSMITFLTGEDDSLPSWVSNWAAPLAESATPMTFEARKGMYHASLDLSPEVGFLKGDRVMTVQGVLVDEVEVCGDHMDIDNCSHLDVMVQWEATMLRRFGYDDSQNDVNDQSADIRYNYWDSSTYRKDSNRPPSRKQTISDVLNHWNTRTTSANSSWPPGYSMSASEDIGSWSQPRKTKWTTRRDRRQQITGPLPPLQETYFGGGDLAEAYCRTLLLDRGSKVGDRFNADTFDAFCDSYINEWNEDMFKPTPNEMKRIHSLHESECFDRALQDAVINRRLFITSKGYIGLGPKNMQNGDKVCVIFGSEVPLVLRQQDGHSNLVGECYVHGIMDGEVLKLEGHEKLRLEIFEME